ncbi:MAG: cache domain-containing protein [Prochloraceae cyanobacterium]|nr:cache domain-containing protein [Prochloraceae cyanobacterium]
MKLIKYLQRFPKNPGLKTTLVAAVLATVSITATIVYLPWLIVSRHNIDKIISQVNDQFALGASKEVEQLFASTQSAQKLLQSSFSQSLINFSNLKEKEAFLVNVAQANPNFTWVQFGDANGDFFGARRISKDMIRFHFRDWNEENKITTKTVNTYELQNNKWVKTDSFQEEMNPPFYAPNRPWYKNAIKNPEKPAWTVYIYRSSNAPGMDGTVTVEKEGKTIGVIGVGIELKQLSEYLRQLREQKESEVFIINSKNELIASTDFNEVMPARTADRNAFQLEHLSDTKNPLLQYASKAISTNLVSISEAKSLQKYAYTDPKSKEKYYVSLTPIGYLDWVVVTVIPENSYLDEIKRNKEILLIAIVVFSLTTVGLAVFATDRLIARPILCVANVAGDIEEEKFELDKLNTIATRTDELGQLARVFKNMARQVYSREKKLKQQVRKLSIEIDREKRKKQVQEIVETDFFQNLVDRAKTLREKNQEKS